MTFRFVVTGGDAPKLLEPAEQKRSGLARQNGQQVRNGLVA
ncbi:hypothetical protein [Rhizobium sp. SRDI969]|nr:hypothetical protein [Rhizobium leguminosarum]UWM82116.1 hypothetical protein N2A41_02225 [Rhizobium leguminosarum bv. viciae]